MYSYYGAKSTNTEWLFKDTAKVIKEIEQTDLKETHVDCSSLKNFKSVGSYNWSLQSTPENPIMIIPGKSSQLVKNLDTKILTKCRYEQISDENRYFLPEFPMEPLFRAVQLCTPSFNFNTVDIVTDRNNLRKLFEFVEGSKNDSFRVDFQKLGNMILLVRNDEHVKGFCDDYNKSFERNFTDSGKDEKHGTYRQVVTYTFGDLQVLTRFDVDCVEETSELVENTDKENMTEKLISSMASVNLGTNKPVKFEKTSKLSSIKSGDFHTKYKQRLVKMATKKTYRGKFEFPQSKWNQLFFSNTDTLLLGWHFRGTLQKVEKLTLEQVTQRCDRDNKNTRVALGKLNHLLHTLKSIAFKEDDESIVYAAIFHQERHENSLEIFKTSIQKQLLSQDLIKEIV